MKKLIELSVEGAKIIDLCVEGDKLLEEATGGVYNKPVKGVKFSKGTSSARFPISHIHNKRMHVGIAFPTCISVNNAVAHFSPLAYVFFPSPSPSIESIMSYVARIPSLLKRWLKTTL